MKLISIKISAPTNTYEGYMMVLQREFILKKRPSAHIRYNYCAFSGNEWKLIDIGKFIQDSCYTDGDNNNNVDSNVFIRFCLDSGLGVLEKIAHLCYNIDDNGEYTSNNILRIPVKMEISNKVIASIEYDGQCAALAKHQITLENILTATDDVFKRICSILLDISDLVKLRLIYHIFDIESMIKESSIILKLCPNRNSVLEEIFRIHNENVNEQLESIDAMPFANHIFDTEKVEFNQLIYQYHQMKAEDRSMMKLTKAMITSLDFILMYGMKSPSYIVHFKNTSTNTRFIELLESVYDIEAMKKIIEYKHIEEDVVITCDNPNVICSVYHFIENKCLNVTIEISIKE